MKGFLTGMLSQEKCPRIPHTQPHTCVIYDYVLYLFIMTASNESLRTPFEQEFNLVPLDGDIEARVARLETLLGGYLRSSLGQSPHRNYSTIRDVETLPLPDGDAVVDLLDRFRDPVQVQARKDCEQQEIVDQNR